MEHVLLLGEIRERRSLSQADLRAYDAAIAPELRLRATD